MNLTEYHKSILRILKRLEKPQIKRVLTDKLHPAETLTHRIPALARVGKALAELELANLIECSTPSIQSWAITSKGLKAIEPETQDDKSDISE